MSTQATSPSLSKWWCAIGNTSKIVECVMKNGIVRPKEEERLMYNFFGDNAEEMEMIAQCESGKKQFLANGEVVTSHTNDYGYFQVNERWIPKAESLGLDIMTLEGNFAMARIIYGIQGYKAWVCSKIVGVYD